MRKKTYFAIDWAGLGDFAKDTLRLYETRDLAQYDMETGGPYRIVKDAKIVEVTLTW